jgi:hypothetical protein
MIGKFSFLSYKNDDCKGRDVLAVKRGAQLKRVCVLKPKGDIGPPSGIAEQLFYSNNFGYNLQILIVDKGKRIIYYKTYKTYKFSQKVLEEK